MHLVGPYLTTTGKKKGKQKFRNAEAARKSRELNDSWEELKKKYATKTVTKKVVAAKLPTQQTPYRRETPHIPSLPFTGGACTKPPEKVYTGTNILGIGTMHKSNAVPIFSDQDAKDISTMRR
jgi:hypothetical protein